MKQKTAFLISLGLTAFMAIMILGMALNVGGTTVSNSANTAADLNSPSALAPADSAAAVDLASGNILPSNPPGSERFVGEHEQGHSNEMHEVHDDD